MIVEDNTEGATPAPRINSAVPPSPKRLPRSAMVPPATRSVALTTVAAEVVSLLMLIVPNGLLSVPAIVIVLPPARNPPVAMLIVPLLVSPPPIISRLNRESSLLLSMFRLPPTLSPPASETTAPFCNSKSPPDSTAVKPLSALFEVTAPPSATKALTLPTDSRPPEAIVPIWPPPSNSSRLGPDSVIVEDNPDGATPAPRINSAVPPLPKRLPRRLIVPPATRSVALTTVGAEVVSLLMLIVP